MTYESSAAIGGAAFVIGLQASNALCTVHCTRPQGVSYTYQHISIAPHIIHKPCSLYSNFIS